MFAIGGAALDDHPEDIERRFSLTSSEVSRLAGRIILMGNWQAAAAPGQANGHAEKSHDAASNGQGGVQQGDAPQDGAPQDATPRPGKRKRRRRDREVTLQ
jgi:hypothetical protein